MNMSLNKKILAFACTAISLSVLSAVLSFGAGTLKGDVNSDGEVDAADAIKIARYDAGLDEYSQEDYAKLKASGDVNGDGRVDAGDAVLIRRYDAGLISSFDDVDITESTTEPTTETATKPTTEPTTKPTTTETTTKKASVGSEDNTNHDAIIDLT